MKSLSDVYPNTWEDLVVSSYRSKSKWQNFTEAGELFANSMLVSEYFLLLILKTLI